jgi:hypothetical protein
MTTLINDSIEVKRLTRENVKGLTFQEYFYAKTNENVFINQRFDSESEAKRLMTPHDFYATSIRCYSNESGDLFYFFD